MNNNNMLDNFESPDEEKRIVFVREYSKDKFDERLIKNLSGLRKPTKYGILGVIIALLFLKLGFWATILILLLFGIGYGYGLYKEGNPKFIRFLMNLFRK
ncbi:DUF2273 domain-containing protein [Finegoldia magna]|uniref:DUF2273 domain-containing protein n=1 Tax=Finegoldia magna (strain ATCC 29328 / DSM 20472 / WAL 2508) TaxID=334413 RepID=B0RZX8_FINM2|nr:DUF2273 domain-containing protein [Finegoldia magna]MDU4732388.1 DUF2273 domain-containing protein [Finegoldia magna]MSB16377.1 DUF2273 domain-containing protein [Finegoldia magna]MSD45242.1 DUF2273 domain-containing protein [Finegoldia magna]UEA70633.1 DUF2273 domain-containing protein [Finegoldia magna]BAG08005.1 conserved hypothetical protein [Finegoldia magna ATCC 29328]